MHVHTVYQTKAFAFLYDLSMIYQENKIVLIHEKSQKRHMLLSYPYSLSYTRRFVVCLSMCHFVLVFFSPFSIAITSLGEERANLGAFRTFVRIVLV